MENTQAPRSHRHRWASVALIGALSLAACSTDDNDTPDVDSASTSEAATPNHTRDTAQDSFNHEDHDHDAGEYHDELTDDDASDVIVQAEYFVEVAAQHDDESAWWDQVEPFLTSTGIPNFNEVDPRNVPYTQRDGDAEIHEAQTPNLVSVDVPTDGPTMRVLLTRGGSDEWLVERWSYAEDS